MWRWYGFWHPWALTYWHPWALSWYESPYWSFWWPVSKEQEIAMLEDQARVLENELESVRKRLEELKAK